ncbi:uncharacterized protein N7459_004236 [Penicillium hispanicum]|uniref:uncharacterized protein n=1 Tax=Penicillium hispanicum TaxID=1080232 RepID=UPI002542530D|nr:uncharacterized protein N7459_004236 [Penicillium hispanicum]KAJ5584436.1 hypothetical protein N7459_004236 [Penicillium hispanicum]
MAWYSILPPQLIQFESWVVRIFFLLGLITIVPWAALILLDAGIYIYQMIFWEFPWIGGRARGHRRPRAPSLNERPDGQRRAFGLRGVETDTSDGVQTRRQAVSVENRLGKENVTPIATHGQAYTSADGELKQRASGRT